MALLENQDETRRNELLIRSYNQEDLQRLWQALYNRQAVSKEERDTLDKSLPLADWKPGKAFEYLVLRLFELAGADIVWPYYVYAGSAGREATSKKRGHPIEQIDGAIYVDSLYCLVESKDWSASEGMGPNRMNFEPIAKLRVQLQRRPTFVLGLVFSMSGFTHEAKQLLTMMLPQSILLWEGSEIDAIVNGQYSGGMRSALKAKVRYAVEQALPDLNIKESKQAT